ncbi:MAG: amidohydrolase family protein [Sphingomonadaceae bacterium]|uniref:N-acyl-D-amino-acid deacylase family protein n=1 Tax=Thermaurantiacus sp. TaxID=2820283 RepID=UPI00298F3D0F|nr:amidohydrolase family protein [Thermaurantiacus sp.]MCS6987594.1 amidohydrolase family protein [Sphingomonadaceae bacterium]MDW8415195.1 amidohydrolase family protein [Thermaurantiacus sp.]
MTAPAHDLVVRGGLVVDGTGLPAFRADVAVDGGRIAAVGAVRGRGRTEIDATGQVVAPGFIDPHTHFDAQLVWDPWAKPAVEHGVTTVVPGNCSLSLAPLRAEHRAKLVGMFNQIEEMPLLAFERGIDWTWESFPDYLARLRRHLSINVAPLVGHSLLRLWVMGDAAMERTATPAEVAAMQALLRDCLAAGAVGLSTSYVDMDERLQPVPSRLADPAEVDALAAVLGEFGRMLQIVPEFYDADLMIARVDQLAELSLRHAIPTTFSPLFVAPDDRTGPERVMARVDEQFARGARVWPQVQTRPIDISFSFAVPSLLFFRMPSWYRLIRFGTPEDVKAAFTDPERRRALVAEAQILEPLWLKVVLRRALQPDNRPLVGLTLAQIAERRGTTPVEAMIDLSLEEDLDAHFLAADMGHNDDARVGALLAHPRVHVGASDGGAHILSFATYGDTGYLFSRFVRGTGALSLEGAVKKLTADTAAIWGLFDRGRIAPGLAADLVVFDPDRIDRGEEVYVHDVPGDGWRYVRGSRGVACTIVNGTVAWSAEGGYAEARGAILPGPQPGAATWALAAE